MNELYELLKQKLESMRLGKVDHAMFNFNEVSQMFQFVCFMKQVKELVNWGEKDE
jgi:hypothetical protein